MEQDKALNPSNVFERYRCTGCGEIFTERYPGTIILTGLHNIRMIGRESQCISVAILANERAERREDRRSPRFHSVQCFQIWMERMAFLARDKFRNPKPEDLR